MSRRRSNGQRNRTSPMSVNNDLATENKSADTMFFTERDTSNTFKDVRSASKPNKRIKTRRKKYHNFEVVKPGQLGSPHYTIDEHPTFPGWTQYPADLTDCKIVNINRKQLFKEAQRLAPSYQSSRDTCSCCRQWRERSRVRRQAMAKADASDWRKCCCLQRDPFLHNHNTLVCAGMGYDEEFEDALDDWYWWQELNARREILNLDAGTDREPQTVYDLGALIDHAVANWKPKVKECGWYDVLDEVWSSPEMDWVYEGAELFEDEEDFELV